MVPPRSLPRRVARTCASLAFPNIPPTVISAGGLIVGVLAACADPPTQVRVSQLAAALSAQQADSLRLTYMCGNQFRVRNPTTDSATVRWDVYGTIDSGRVIIAPRPAGQAYSETFFTTRLRGTTRLFYAGRLVQTKANGGTVCAVAAVPAAPPDSVAADVYADSNLVTAAPTVSGPRMVRNLLTLAFYPSATAAQRVQAVASVGGVVVGGRRFGDSTGLYLVRIPSDARGDAVLRTIGIVEQQPGVAVASPELVADDSTAGDYRRPKDDPAVGTWTVSPDSSTTDANWAFERVGAPLAWGCATGDARTPVAVVDRGFWNVPDLMANVTRNSEVENPLDARLERHGLAVASIVGARGDNGTGIAGMMWQADLRLYSRKPLLTLVRIPTSLDLSQLYRAARDGARVINSSFGLGYEATQATTAQDAARIDSTVQSVARQFSFTIRTLDAEGRRPLFVMSAGNVRDPQNYTTGTPVDARWNAYPLGAADWPDRTLVVAASTQQDYLARDSRGGPLVALAAPGERLLSLDRDGTANMTFGQTSGATPFVSGAAGLLFSFDPTLTAADVRALLIAGAVQGGRRATGWSTYPILNAYEALKLAARRNGAPLCGNRLWIDSQKRIVVERDRSTGSLEAIATLPGDLYATNITGVFPVHGGRQVFIAYNDWPPDVDDAANRDFYARAVLDPATGKWSVSEKGTWVDWFALDVADRSRANMWVQNPWSPFSGPAGSMYQGARTHDGDTTVYLQYVSTVEGGIPWRAWWGEPVIGGDVNTLSFWIGSDADSAVGSGRQLISAPRDPVPASVYTSSYQRQLFAFSGDSRTLYFATLVVCVDVCRSSGGSRGA